MPELLLCERRDGNVEVVTLHRPERRNAMVPELMAALAEHLASLVSNPPAAVVLTGTPPAFCVGADVKWLSDGRDPAEGVAALVADHHAAVRAMREVPAPVIAAVNGPAAGGGLSLALAADYRVSSDTATYTAAYFPLGLPPDGGNSAFLARMLGASKAMELLLTNRTLTAAEALAWGLVSEVTSLGHLLPRALEVAARVAGVPGPTLLDTRQLLDGAYAQPLLRQLQQEAVAMRTAARQRRFAQALQAFAFRRAASAKGPVESG